MNKFKSALVDLLLRYLSKKPIARISSILTVAKLLDRDEWHSLQLAELRRVLVNEDGVWHRYLEELFREVDKRVLRKIVKCLLVNASLDARLRACEKKISLQYPMGDTDGSHKRMQSLLHRLLGRAIRQQTQPGV